MSLRKNGKLLLSIIFLFIGILLTSCSKPDMEGIVLEVNKNYIQVATELSLDEYEEIKDKSALEIQNEDVLGDTYRGLIDLTYEHTDEFSKGDEVEIWIDGGIRESYPSGADAKKIRHKK